MHKDQPCNSDKDRDGGTVQNYFLEGREKNETYMLFIEWISNDRKQY